MIKINQSFEEQAIVEFIFEEDDAFSGIYDSVRNIFHGKTFEKCYVPMQAGCRVLYIGLGRQEDLNREILLDAAAIVGKELLKQKEKSAIVKLDRMFLKFGMDAVEVAVQGFLLGTYRFQNKEVIDLGLLGIPQGREKEAEECVERTCNICRGILFARDMVNMPGNQLRPKDFANSVKEFLSGLDIEIEQLMYGQIKTMGMDVLAAVGGSSEYPPCFLVLRYRGNPLESEVIGMAGKGVTCDTGGYCLKSSGSMLGIKGDMAGGAAVAGAIYAMAKNKIKVNVTGLIPMCENRISAGSLLPGDVIGSMSGKTIEIINTDAEGRLILADALTYGIQKEKVTKIVDIATLTGAVVQALGFGTAGVLADDESFYRIFSDASAAAVEQYLRFPIRPEYEKMLESEVADIKNLGERFAGSITAGLFIRNFAEGLPWIHMDIAGTAWVDKPVFGRQVKGATGAGVTTLYYLAMLSQR